MKIKKLCLAAFASVCAGFCGASEYDLAAYVWPAYQPEPRWKELGIFEHGCGEWQNVYEATPKKPGHRQPKVPLWGYENEADPIVVARKIDAALAAGVNVFIYDWYWYRNRPFLENALNEGFLKAPNSQRMKFFIMWANHDVNYLWDNKKADKNANPPLFDAKISFDEFKKIADRWISKYFSKPNYYKIGGKPVVSIYRVKNFIAGVGGEDKAKEALDYLKKRAAEAGLGGAHVMTTSEISKELADKIGIDSTTVYSWNDGTYDKIQKAEPNLTYREWMGMATALWDKKKSLGIPYFPNVTVGWDTNPRFPKEKFAPMVTGANPTDFERALRQVKDWLDKNTPQGMPKLVTINSWNEWTEGTYLEPDTENGYAYLNAIARVFMGQ